MSGKIEKADSQRSHLSSFTMKLKDKFHSPKIIKRTPSKKGKPADLSVKPIEKPVNKTLSRLEEQEKEVVNALRYFKTIVDKMAVDKMVLVMLPGSASKVLEAILPLVQADTHTQQSTAIASCYSRVYQSLANLIRWSDQVMLEGVNCEDKEMVSTVKDVIKAVLDGVKELVRLMIEKQERPSPTSPVKPALPAGKSDSTQDLPLSERELEILNKSPEPSRKDVPVDCVETDELAPPKPPLPGIRVVENSPPPALPPKKRQSAPSPTRVAVVAPMSRATSGSSIPIGVHMPDFEVNCYAHRRLSGGSQSYGGESPRLSPCSSIGKLSKSDEQLSSLDRDSGQCSRNTSCETLDNYDPDYEFLQQDLSSTDQVTGVLSPLPESLGETGSPFHGQNFQLPPNTPPHSESTHPATIEAPPALPEKKRRSAVGHNSDGSRVCYERHPSQYDNISEDDLLLPPTGTPFAAVSPFQPGITPQMDFLGDFIAAENDDIPEKPPPLPEKKNKHMMTYMRFVEDYSEPQPSVFYQTPQNEHIYQQKNKHLREEYGFNDSFSSMDPGVERAPPPALPPKQRQLQAPFAASSFSSVSYCAQPAKGVFNAPEDGSHPQGISLSASNCFLSRHGSFPVPSYKSVFRSYSQDFAPHSQAPALPLLSPAIFYTSRYPLPDSVPPLPVVPPASLCPPLASSQGSSVCGTPPACLPFEPPFTGSLQTSANENSNEEAGDGEYVNLHSSGQSNGAPLPSDGESPSIDDEQQSASSSQPCAPGSENHETTDRLPNSPGGHNHEAPEAEESDELDELSLVDHNEIMAKLTLKQEGDDGPDVRGGSGDILLVHATETDRKDLVLYCEAFLTTYRTFITPEELIQKLQYRYERFCHFQDTFKQRVSKNTFFVLVRVVDELCLVELTDEILKLLMELVFKLVCKGDLSLARVLRKNILEKVDNKRMQSHCNSAMRPLAARGVAARPGTLHDFHSHEIAEQLTLLDAELFYKIEIPEVLLWAKEQNEEKSPNLTQFTEHFNNMSYWVRSIIMLQEKAQDRERLLLKFIKIMKHLRKLNNFNSYLAILSALDSAPIRRLEWQKQTSEGLAEYCTLIDSSSSFRAYRAALSEVEPPCIPYLGLILQDLTFVHLGNPDHIDGKVNFSKRWQQFNILDSMRRFQQVHYEIRRNDDIISFFNDFSDHLAEEALWELSLKIKPRNITRRKTERDEKT
ncbi:PREDICTED: rap guanine nucleotide exchange factor 1 isoform X2 [Nanorana parkeri]|uniref:rap guanine nucleotide exchange factor 1 isoform X2 n=1 Tax=Nanorana parkeri TaxID=125878 RepID=UPI0008545E24|nr:PREDICTED: rap guanine nucleotide exchange factor 1 isoform X2 [Nanorana parkeri]